MSETTTIRAPGRSDPHKILRFRKSERMIHWAFAVPFLVCYATAAILIVVYYNKPGDPQRALISWIHRVSGLFFFALPPAVMLIKRRDIRFHINNVKQAWVWTIADVKWLALLGAAAVDKRVTMPDQGKFNAAEKLNFMLLMTTHPFYLLTGVLIWFTHGAFFAWMAHLFMVMIATPLIFGHMYMAILNPATRVGLPGMITGYVDRKWAKHHYRKWYDEKVQDHQGGSGGDSVDSADSVDSVPSVPSVDCFDTVAAEPTPVEHVAALLDAIAGPLVMSAAARPSVEPQGDDSGRADVATNSRL